MFREFTVMESFVVRSRGTVLVGLRASEVREMVAVGAVVEMGGEGKTVRARVAGIEGFMVSPPQDDTPVGILLAEDIGRVPGGTVVRVMGRRKDSEIFEE